MFVSADDTIDTVGEVGKRASDIQPGKAKMKCTSVGILVVIFCKVVNERAIEQRSNR